LLLREISLNFTTSSSPSKIGLNPNAVDRAAIFFKNNDVLRHVHELTGEIAGVSRLEGRVGQTLRAPCVE